MGETGDRLRTARTAAGFKSARAAALKFGWSPSTYASHENGQTDPVPTDAAFDYGKAFKVSPFWILYNLGPREGSIDAMLTGQPKDIWDLARATVEAIIKTRG
jgi:hypothetical protein